MLNYAIDYYGTLRIYDGDKLVSSISNCGDLNDEQIQGLVKQTEIIIKTLSAEESNKVREWTKEDIDNLKEFLMR